MTTLWGYGINRSYRIQAVFAARPATNYCLWRCANKTWNRRGASWPPAYFCVVDCYRGPLTGSPRERIRKVSHNMLHAVHRKYRTREASSLYCVWTSRDGSSNSPLIAIWIDPSMCGFEEEASSTAQSDSEEVRSDEPGGCALVSAGPQVEIPEDRNPSINEWTVLKGHLRKITQVTASLLDAGVH